MRTRHASVATEITPSPARRPRRRLGRVLPLVGGLALVVGLAVAAQETWRMSARAELATGADVVRINGDRSLRIVCSGHGPLTYVLEAGATGFAETWSRVQGHLDDGARVCSYDRAGLGLSDPAPDGFDPERTSEDLAAALAAHGERGPYVLVGHSLGGLLVRDFASRRPEEVAGLVLVDPSHEDQLSRFEPAMVDQFRAFPGQLRLLAGVSRLGVLHLHNPLEAGAEGLDGDALRAASVFAGDHAHLAAAAAELDAWDALTRRAREAALPAEIPLLVVTAGAAVPGSPDFSDVNEELHAELAARSSRGRHQVMAEAHHFSIVMGERHAEDLAGRIERFTAAIAARGGVGARAQRRLSKT